MISMFVARLREPAFFSESRPSLSEVTLSRQLVGVASDRFNRVQDIWGDGNDSHA
jgi:hypothetical protein